MWKGGRVAAADADYVYYVTSDLPGLRGHPIWKVPTGGGTPVALVCDRYQLAITDTDGVYPTSGAIGAEQVAVTADTIYWLERRATDGPVTLFSAPL